VVGRNAELGWGVRESKVEKKNELFEAIQDVREHEVENIEGSSELNLFIEHGPLGLRDAQTKASNAGHLVSNEIQNSTSRTASSDAGDIQEYDEVGHVWLDRTRSTSPSTHALES
jgi:hypothetical protein